MAKFYFTFGSSSAFPYQNGYLVIEADNLKDAAACFKEHYPNKSPDVLNCSDYYTELQWEKVQEYYQGEAPKEVLYANFLNIDLDTFDAELLGEAVYEETTSAFSGTFEEIGNDLLNVVRYDCKTQRDFDLVNSAVVAITGSSLKTLVRQAKEKEETERDL